MYLPHFPYFTIVNRTMTDIINWFSREHLNWPRAILRSTISKLRKAYRKKQHAFDKFFFSIS